MSESAVQKLTDTQALTTGIILTSAGLFAGRNRREMGDVGPLTRIGGLSLFQRTVLTLQRSGINQLFILVGEEEEALKQSLRHGPRVTIPVRWMPVREFPPEDHRTWETLASEAKGVCIIAGAQATFSRGLIERLSRDVQEGQATLVVRDVESWERQVTGGNPIVRCQGDRVIEIHEKGMRGGSQVEGERGEGRVAADLLVLPAGFLGSRAGEAAVPPARLLEGEKIEGRAALRRVLDQAVSSGHVRVIQTVGKSPQWYRDVQDPGGVRRVERLLFQSLKSEFEGFVDRYFNRQLSRVFTKVFLWMGLSPNTITVLATLLGLMAAMSFAMGSYGAGVVAALLFQLAAVIDCCDGEMARLTFRESAFGAWLDIAADNVVHMAIFAGIAWGAYVRQGAAAGSKWPLVLGAVAVSGNALSFWLVNKAQFIRSTRGWENPVQATWSNFILKNMATRDFSVIVLIFAVVHKLDWFLWMAAIGSTLFWMIMVVVIRPSLRPRS